MQDKTLGAVGCSALLLGSIAFGILQLLFGEAGEIPGIIILSIGVVVAWCIFCIWMVKGTADRLRAVAGVFGVAMIAGMFYRGGFDLLDVIVAGCMLLIGAMIFKTSWQGGHLECVCWAVALGGSVEAKLAGTRFAIRAGVIVGSVALLYLLQAGIAKSPISHWLSNEKSKRKRKPEATCSTPQLKEVAAIPDQLQADEEELPY